MSPEKAKTGAAMRPTAAISLGRESMVMMVMMDGFDRQEVWFLSLGVEGWGLCWNFASWTVLIVVCMNNKRN